MATKYQSTGRAMTLPAGVLLGAGMAFIWTIAMSAVMAKLIEMEVFPESAVGYGSMVILLTASALASSAFLKVLLKSAINITPEDFYIILRHQFLNSCCQTKFHQNILSEPDWML